jgi:hypothetical protein
MAYYESDRYANRRNNSNYNQNRDNRYSSNDREGSARLNEGYERPNERRSRWEDNDHGRASWYDQDYGWRTNTRDSDYYGAQSGRYSTVRNYTGGYDNDEGDNGRYTSRADSRDDEYTSRRGRSSDNYKRENDNYGNGFNEDSRQMNRNNNYDPYSRYGSSHIDRSDDDDSEYDSRRY